MAKRPDIEANNAIDGAKDFARDELLGARHWKRSKVGYLSGGSAVTDAVGSVGRTGKESLGRVSEMYRAAFRKDRGGVAVNSEGTPRERFLDAMVANGRTIEEIDRSVDNTYTQFWFYVMLSLGVVFLAFWSLAVYGFAAPGGPVFSTLLSLVRFAPLAALGPLTLRAGWTNWAFRKRQLHGVTAYLKSGELLPKKAKGTAMSGIRSGGTKAIALVGGAVTAYMAYVVLGLDVALAQQSPPPADIFTDPAKSDMFMRLMAYVIPDTGPIGTPAEGLTTMHAATKTAFMAFSGTLLFIGMAMSGWHILSGLVASAKEGTAIGRNYHEVWAPARVVVGFGMLTPVAGGICGAQLLVIYLIAWGGNLANAVYQPYIDTMTVQQIPNAGRVAGDTVVIGNQAVATDIAKMIATKELCNQTILLVDKRQAGSVAGRAVEKPEWKEAKVGGLSIFGATIMSGTIVREIDYGPVCGKLTVNAGQQNASGDQQIVHQIQEARYNAIQTMQDSISGALGNYVQSYQVSQGSQGPAFADDTTAASLVSIFDQARRTYLQKMQTTITQIYNQKAPGQNETSASMKAVASEAKTNGWSTSGVFYLTLARLSNAVYSAATEGLKSSEITMTGMDVKSRAYTTYLVGGDGRSGILPQFDGWWKRNITKFVPDISSQATAAASSSSSWGDLLNVVFGNGAAFWNSYTADSAVALNPMQSMVDYGNRLMIWGTGSYVVASKIQTAATRSEEGKAGKLETLIGYLPLANDIRDATASLMTIAMMLSLVMVAAGAVHAYILPLVPYIMTVFFVASMLVLVVESLVAAPIWAFVHIRMDGQEFVDQVQKPGYMIAFNLILRPSLMVFGLILSYLVFGAMMWFVAKTFNPAATGLAAMGSVGPIGMIVLIALQSYLDYQVAVRSFQLILQVPDRVTRWFGQGGENLGEDNDSHRISGAVVGQVQSRVEGLSRAQQLARGGNRGVQRADTSSNTQDADVGGKLAEGGGAAATSGGGAGKIAQVAKKANNAERAG